MDDAAQTILFVEDEPAVRTIFSHALRRAGYQVIEARNGAEAIDAFEAAELRIDLLLTDVRMPHVDGSDLAQRLTARRPGLRTLFVSGYAERLELGPNAMLLQKPFVRADLLRAVRAMLDHQGAV